MTRGGFLTIWRSESPAVSESLFAISVKRRLLTGMGHLPILPIWIILGGQPLTLGLHV